MTGQNWELLPGKNVDIYNLKNPPIWIEKSVKIFVFGGIGVLEKDGCMKIRGVKRPKSSVLKY